MATRKVIKATAEELRFSDAIKGYKEDNDKLFITWKEVLGVVKKLGYSIQHAAVEEGLEYMGNSKPSCPICQIGHDKEHQAELDEKMGVFEAELDPKRKKRLEKRIKDLKAESTSLILIRGRGKMSWECPVRIKKMVDGKEDPREHYEAPHFTMTK